MSGVNASFDNDPARYDDMRSCWLNDRREAFILEHLRSADSSTPHALLEIGSGTGWLLHRLTHHFPDWSFCGIDPIPGYVDYSTDTYGQDNLEFHNSGAEQAATVLGDRTFDFLLSNDVLHHVTSEQETVHQAARLAKPGARWLAIEPNALNPYAFAGQALKSGERNFRPRQFAAIAADAGWQLTNRSYLFLVPPFMKAPPNWLKRLEGRLEGIPFVGGGVALEFVYKPRPEANEEEG